MFLRPAILAGFAMAVLASGTGCQKSNPPAPAAPPTVLAPDTIASVHWVGKRRLDLAADAYYFSRVWSLPETVRLQAQTFDRWSVATWRVLLGEPAAARIPAALLRPLFDELAVQESYLEIRAATGAPPCFVLATRVSERYLGVWETNSAIAAELLAGAPAVPDPARHGWTLQRTNAPNRIALSRIGDWSVLSVGPGENRLADEIAARIRRDGVPFVSAGTNLWFEASLNPSRLADCFARSDHQTRGEVGLPERSSIFHLPSSLSHVSLSLSGDGANVITRAKMDFFKPFAADSPAWQLPLPLLHEPLTSFTAVRGLQPWLKDWPVWRDLALGAPPDQFFLWSLAGSSYQVYLAAPSLDAQKQIGVLADRLLQQGNPWLAAHGYISFDRAADGNGVTWGNLPDIKPFVKAAGTGADQWLYAGLLPADPTNAAPPPAGMIQDILRRTNLVYYDWEVTGPRLLPCLELGQTVRLITRRPQLAVDSASLKWLAVLVPRLGTSATLINRIGPAELTFYRRSTLGLTAPELQLLADWLESPEFPR